MRTTIYFFSATGNSMTTAYALAQGIENSAVIPVAATKNLHRIDEQADAVGFVFPIYFGDMPYIVREMISKMTFNPDAYIFACVTFRGGRGVVTGKLDQLLRTRGQKLSLCCDVPMPGNSAINPPEVDAEHLKNQPENVAKALADILDRKVEDYFTSEIIPMRPVDVASNFRGIIAEDTCIGCGTCESICPMNNIKIVDGKSIIGDNCTTCLACFHWCPVEAIYMSTAESFGRRGPAPGGQPGGPDHAGRPKPEPIGRRIKDHHPDVTLEDIASQKM